MWTCGHTAITHFNYITFIHQKLLSKVSTYCTEPALSTEVLKCLLGLIITNGSYGSQLRSVEKQRSIYKSTLTVIKHAHAFISEAHTNEIYRDLSCKLSARVLNNFREQDSFINPLRCCKGLIIPTGDDSLWPKQPSAVFPRQSIGSAQLTQGNTCKTTTKKPHFFKKKRAKPPPQCHIIENHYKMLQFLLMKWTNSTFYNCVVKCVLFTLFKAVSHCISLTSLLILQLQQSLSLNF